MARYKVLKSIAHSFGHSFTSLMNYRGDDYVMDHLLRRARETGDVTLMVDILTGRAAPASLLTPHIASSIADRCAWFPKLVESHRTNLAFIRAARMSITFDLATKRPNQFAPACLESPFVCRTEIEDDRGKLWVSELRDWWFPEPAHLNLVRSALLADSVRQSQAESARQFADSGLAVEHHRALRHNEALKPTSALMIVASAAPPHLTGALAA